MMSQSRRIVLLKLLGFILLTVACSISVNPDVNINVVEVVNLSVSSKIDRRGRSIDPATVFPTKTKRVYVSFYLKTNKEVPITVLWYKDDELIFQQESRHSTDWVFTWIQPEQQFSAGQYRVEIRSQTVLLADTEFKIVQDDRPASSSGRFNLGNPYSQFQPAPL